MGIKEVKTVDVLEMNYRRLFILEKPFKRSDDISVTGCQPLEFNHCPMECGECSGVNRKPCVLRADSLFEDNAAHQIVWNGFRDVPTEDRSMMNKWNHIASLLINGVEYRLIWKWETVWIAR